MASPLLRRGSSRSRQSSRAPRQIFLDAGPFRGMRDSLDPSAADDKLAFLLQNVYPTDSDRGSSVVGRPGFQKSGTVQLGSAGVRTGQLVYQFTKLAGTEITVVLVGGKLYTFNWGTRVFTESVTAANFATASITLSTTAHCYAVTFADKMVVSDGVNKPWSWDGTAGAGGLTSLTNAPVIYGQPTVYYAKLFGIKNTARSTIVWSEENAPATGYEAGGYANAWTLGQTDQEPLFALVGTNDALYYLRSRSTGVISGAVNSDFVTAGVHDGVSGLVGTQSPGCTVYYEGRIYFPDANFQPHVIIPGSGVEPLWGDVRETVLGMDRAYVTSAVGVYDASTKMVLLGEVATGQTIPSVQFVFDPKQGIGQAVALWRGFTFQAMALVKNATGQPLLMHLSDDGYAYDHGLPDGTLWSDGLNAATVAIEHIAEPGPMGNDISIEKKFDRLDMNFRTASGLTGVTVHYETSRGLSTAPVLAAPSITGGFARWDIAIWDTGLWSASSLEQHVAVGLNAQGRWIRPIIKHVTAGEQFGLGTVRITATPIDTAQGNP